MANSRMLLLRKASGCFDADGYESVFYVEGYESVFLRFRILSNEAKKIVVQRRAAVASAIGSASQTPIIPSPPMCGRIRASGIRRMILRKSAINREMPDCPSATKVV